MSWPSTEADSNGMIKKAGVTDIPYLDCPVSQRERQLVKVRASVFFSLAGGNVKLANNPQLVGQKQSTSLNAKETKKKFKEDFTPPTENMAVQSDLNTFQFDIDKSTVVHNPKVKGEGKGHVADLKAPFETLDALYIMSEVKDSCDPVQLQLNRKKSSLTQLPLEFSFKSESCPGSKYMDLRRMSDRSVDQISPECNDRDVSSLESLDTKKLHESWGGGSISEESKILPSETGDSKGVNMTIEQLNRLGTSAAEGERAGGADFSSQCVQDDACSLSEKWPGGKHASECASISFSGSIPYSGPLSLSGPISFSGLTTYSSQVPHSGSVSIRSESSTTSTRSFAFPILTGDWNGSPVKIPQPDLRRRQRKWRLRCCCICCGKPSTLFD